jgi:ubiquitin carboxyl-terminal hydrolase 16
VIPNKSAPLLRATSHLRTTLDQVKTSSKPVDLDIDTIILPPGIEWKLVKGAAVKRTELSQAPRVMAVHLVRSMYERGYGAGRNGCEVTFDEEIRIPIGGEVVEKRKDEESIDEEDDIDYNKRYRLMSVVTHKGGHDSGHYLCYRRRKRERRSPRHLPEKSGESKADVIHNVMDINEEKLENGGDNGVASEVSTIRLGFDERVTRIEKMNSRTKWWEVSDEVVTGVNRTDVLSKRQGVYILFYERIL